MILETWSTNLTPCSLLISSVIQVDTFLDVFKLNNKNFSKSSDSGFSFRHIYCFFAAMLAWYFISCFQPNVSGSAPQHLEPQNLRLSNATIMSEPGPALTPVIQTSSHASGCHSNASGSHSRMMTNQSQSSVEAYSPFTRRRNEDPYFGLHLLDNNPQSFCYRSNPEGLCSRSNPGICDPRHLSNPGSLGPHSATPPCSYNNRRVGPMWSHGYICHGFVESLPTTPLPPLVVDTVGFIQSLQSKFLIFSTIQKYSILDSSS